MPTDQVRIEGKMIKLGPPRCQTFSRWAHCRRHRGYEGHFDNAPESLHERPFQLLGLIAANHPFVDGNKRTALTSARIFYAVNDLRVDYDRKIKEILKALATDDHSVEKDDVIEYLRGHIDPLALEYEATINL